MTHASRVGACVVALSALALVLQGCRPGTIAGPDGAALLAGPPPSSLAALGFFEPPRADAPLAPRPGVERYGLVNALFSDHAIKDRQVWLPPGTSVGYDERGVLRFPVGTAILKTFSLAPDLREPQRGARRIETRLLVRRAAGWVAWPYVWNEAQTDAVYTPVGAQRSWDVIGPDGRALHIDYRVPDQNQCKTCHRDGDAITPIGPTARNLRGGASEDLLADWSARGMLRGLPPAHERVPQAFDAAQPVGPRARAWLDINCAHCHRRGGSASNSGLYLGWYEPAGTSLGFGKRPVAAGRGAGEDLFVVDPGHPERSIMVHRIDSVEPGVAMPELGRSVHDPAGTALVAAWIASLPAGG